MSGFFKASLFFYIMCIGAPLRSQICSGDIIVPVVDFNQCNENEWLLVFSDEFDGDKLDLSKWSSRTWSEGDLNNGSTVQYYTLDNVKVDSGVCSLAAKKESVTRKAGGDGTPGRSSHSRGRERGQRLRIMQANSESYIVFRFSRSQCTNPPACSSTWIIYIEK